jgi:hypothetical protein
MKEVEIGDFRPPIKAHRVATVEEVQRLESAGVDYIGFHVDDDAFLGIDNSPFWADDRYLLLDQLPELLDSVVHARPYVETSPEIANSVIEKMLTYGVTLLQVNPYLFTNDTWLEAQKQKGIEIIYGNQYVVPGDDPRFLGLTNRAWPCLFGIDLQIFPSEIDAWSLFSAPSPEVIHDIVTLPDVEGLAKKIPIFISLNYTKENCAIIKETLLELQIKGLSLTLSPTKYGSFHTYEIEELLQIVSALGLSTK